MDEAPIHGHQPAEHRNNAMPQRVTIYSDFMAIKKERLAFTRRPSKQLLQASTTPSS